MNPGLILTKSQAEAVYSAMCALNSIGGTLKTALGCGVCVTVNEFGVVGIDPGESTVETHASQSAFAAVYGIGSFKELPDGAALDSLARAMTSADLAAFNPF